MNKDFAFFTSFLTTLTHPIKKVNNKMLFKAIQFQKQLFCL